MPRMCAICKKIARVGNNVSHANNKTKTRNLPNLQKVRAFFEGKVQKIDACTRCIRSGKVTKAA
jgi:large subunit ribosomal protein L28